MLECTYSGVCHVTNIGERTLNKNCRSASVMCAQKADLHWRGTGAYHLFAIKLCSRPLSLFCQRCYQLLSSSVPFASTNSRVIHSPQSSHRIGNLSTDASAPPQWGQLSKALSSSSSDGANRNTSRSSFILLLVGQKIYPDSINNDEFSFFHLCLNAE